MIFAATSKEDAFRKPRIGMWNTYAKEVGLVSKQGTTQPSYFRGGLTLGMDMFFVGDAGGRVQGHATGRPKDFADTDR
jgi:hypothetical protein